MYKTSGLAALDLFEVTQSGLGSPASKSQAGGTVAPQSPPHQPQTPRRLPMSTNTLVIIAVVILVLIVTGYIVI